MRRSIGCALIAVAAPFALFSHSSPLLAIEAQEAKATKTAKLITVRIEGATQGSGVIVDKKGNYYSIVTAYHVISANKIGEEVVAITHDGSAHVLPIKDVKRIGNTDLALAIFKTNRIYPLANIGTAEEVKISQKVYVAGFPIFGDSKLKISPGEIKANAPTSISNGYELVYNSATIPGMSGGPILIENGKLIGIHGRGESDDLLTKVEGLITKTGFNQGIPIDFYTSYIEGKVYESSSKSKDDSYLAQAETIVSTTINGSEKTVLRLLDKAEK